MTHALTVRTACPILELLSFELLENPAAVADVLVLNVHKTQSSNFITQGRHAWVKTLVRPLPSHWFELPNFTAGKSL
jgi:hypothetical protein